MAYREQHERNCPACGERLSATAPKCLNCGRFVDGREDEERAPPRPASWATVTGVLGTLFLVSALAYLAWNRRPDPHAEIEAAARKTHKMIARATGRTSPNATSQVTLAEVEPRLRKGMPFDELTRIVGERTTGPDTGTMVGPVPLPGKGGADDEEGRPRPGAYIIYLKDADLYVRTDEGQNVVSWRSEPAR